MRNWDLLLDEIERVSSLKGAICLDVGCGAGTVSSLLVARGANVVGMDRDPIMVALSHKRCPGGRFFVGDARIPDFETPKADVVWSSFVISYFADAVGFIVSWSSMLKPGGLLCLLDVSGLFRVHRPLDEKFLDVATRLDSALEPVYFASYGERLADMCREAGLEVVAEVEMDDSE